MKKIAISVLFAISIVFPARALAHDLASDGQLTAILHLDPDDDPVVGGPAALSFEFKDKQGKFSLTACDCLVRISQGSSEMLATKIFEGKTPLLSRNVSVTFPRRASYAVTLTGQPKVSEAFEPFTLAYGIDVTRESSQIAPALVHNSGHRSHYLDLVLFGGVFAVFFGLFFKQKYESRTEVKTSLHS